MYVNGAVLHVGMLTALTSMPQQANKKRSPIRKGRARHELCKPLQASPCYYLNPQERSALCVCHKSLLCCWMWASTVPA